MKNSSFLFALALAASALAADPTGTATAPAPLPDRPAPSSAADRDWNALMDTLKNSAPPADYAQRSPSEQLRSDETRLQRIQDLQLAFIDAHPTDPRRWEMVATLRRSGGRFVKEILPAYDTNPVPENLVIDREAKIARLRRIGALEDALLTATDVPAKLSLAKYRPLFAARKLDDAMAIARMQPVADIDFATLEAKLDAYAREFPNDREAAWIEETYWKLIRDYRPEALLARLNRGTQSPNAHVRNLAQGNLRIETARHTPLEMKFTSFDGREVDLAQLRGKVVLIDFWATWCGPCIEELPNVKAAYEKFHAQGFEVVGIAVDGEADREKLRQFIARENLPWPQYFDGKKWKTALVQEFSISAIPAMFLLGKDGRLASTAARGKNLETEIERLLKL